ncbi:DUF1475 family protein [Prosthecobacter sp.]|uniref:DUF1475 family protein n=1 Tax=Prosthecobacter sp. TaxID=1965333 RepID=UPI001D79AF9B|nr:DUF1475 family protein [Prosthecobacter sp.]MCB1276326.1 DUF1475 family protein [Prosthecobacter sp.]
MIVFLRCLFVVVLVSMLSVTSWASMNCALWDIPAAVGGHPWFIATLFDTYWAFLTFYCWVFYKERTWPARFGWLLGILLLGNIVMAVYMLIQLFRVPPTARVEDVLLRQP